MPTIKMTYEQIKARKEKLIQDKRDLEFELSAQNQTGLIEVEIDDDIKIPKKKTVNTEKINLAVQDLNDKIDKWTALEEKHRPKPKHFIDELLEGLPDDTEFYHDMQIAKSLLT